jgi:hypothetical protein
MVLGKFAFALGLSDFPPLADFLTIDLAFAYFRQDLGDLFSDCTRLPEQ